ncbi:hypothetical protein AK812_SmicGene28885 [Symbiodinium microadriaticum]|uniref:Uncharacterized protein n=1 Tax=Symbiodinium microadriaticum TaxID=2951 RepID=A0A1Q9D379_SYMMI|nr:hypothetical protein AK812_SmicGene28885 [Symbiodinium microadriaticum]
MLGALLDQQQSRAGQHANRKLGEGVGRAGTLIQASSSGMARPATTVARTVTVFRQCFSLQPLDASCENAAACRYEGAERDEAMLLGRISSAAAVHRPLRKECAQHAATTTPPRTTHKHNHTAETIGAARRPCGNLSGRLEPNWLAAPLGGATSHLTRDEASQQERGLAYGGVCCPKVCRLVWLVRELFLALLQLGSIGGCGPPFGLERAWVQMVQEDLLTTAPQVTQPKPIIQSGGLGVGGLRCMRLCLYGGGVAASLRVPVDNGDTDDSAAPGVASQRIVGAEIECAVTALQKSLCRNGAVDQSNFVDFVVDCKYAAGRSSSMHPDSATEDPEAEEKQFLRGCRFRPPAAACWHHIRGNKVLVKETIWKTVAMANHRLDLGMSVEGGLAWYLYVATAGGKPDITIHKSQTDKAGKLKTGVAALAAMTALRSELEMRCAEPGRGVWQVILPPEGDESDEDDEEEEEAAEWAERDFLSALQRVAWLQGGGLSQFCFAEFQERVHRSPDLWKPRSACTPDLPCEATIPYTVANMDT